MKKLIILFLPVFLFQCKHNDKEFEGPALLDLFGEFDVVQPMQVSPKIIDFSDGSTVVFSAEFSKNSPWKVEVTGENSGATFTLEGINIILNESNAVWKGGADAFPGFGLEKAFVKMSFPGQDNAPIFYDTVTIIGQKKDEGTLITSFENGLGTNWSVFNQAGVAGDIVCNDGNSVKGSCHYSIAGTVPWDWAIGSVTINPDNPTFGLQSNPDNLYFNLGLNVVEGAGATNAFIQLWFDEDDNGNGTFDPNSEDRYMQEYWVDASGWKLYSIKYNEINLDIDGNEVQTNGNGILEPSKLQSINVFFLANKDDPDPKKILLDHMIFTTNEPYKP